MKIQNLDKLIGRKFLFKYKVGKEKLPFVREINRVGEIKDLLDRPLYSFQFDSVDSGRDWLQKFEVRLSRDKNLDGFYELFVMGFHSLSVIEVTKTNILNMEQFSELIHRTIKIVIDYYENN